MTSRRQLTLVAAGATLLASAPIGSIFASYKWLVHAVFLVGLIAGAAFGVRSMRGRLWAQIAAMVGALLVGLTMLHGNGTGIIGLIPGPETFEHWSTLLAAAGPEIQTASPPAGDYASLLFITSLGIGVVAVIVDIFAAGLRRPALAGLPMLAIYSVPVAVYVESTSFLPFIVGALGFLWLLVTDNVDKVRRFGRRFTGDGRGVDLWEPSPLSATGRRLAVTTVLIAVLVPMFIPGMTEGFFTQMTSGGQGGPNSGKAGAGGSVDLAAYLHGQLNNTEIKPLVTIKTNDPSPLYARFGVADDVNINGFRHRAPAGRPVGNDLQRPAGMDMEGVSGQRYSASVEVDKNFDMPMVPVYPGPLTTKGLNATWSYDADQQIIFSQRSRSGGVKYEFEFVHLEFTPEVLRKAKPLSPNNINQKNFTAVPENTTVRNLVTTLTEGKPTVYDKVRSLYDYFSTKNGFSYDLSVPQGTTGDRITDFLTGKKGFCQQYAAALAWMVRQAGIPARVAFGFTKGSNYNTNGTYVLTNHNLHAWTEVYFEGYGWIPFDATPSSSVAGAVNPAWAPDPDAPAPTDPSADPSANPNEDPIAGRTPEGDNGADPENGDPGVSAIEQSTPPWMWWSIGAGAALIIAFFVPAMRRNALRRRRHRGQGSVVVQDVTGDPAMSIVAVADPDAARRQAHDAWDELLDTMTDYRVLIDVSETPRGTAERLIKVESLPPSAAEQVRRLSHAEERARYALSPAASDGLMSAVQVVRKILAGNATRWVRFVAVILPPSVTQRWRAAVTNATARVSAKFTEAGYLMRRLTRPLRLRRATR